jgi:hypothetical protein
VCHAQQSGPDTYQNDADIFDRTVGEQPLEVVLRQGKRDAQQSADGAETNHHPPGRRRHRQPAAKAHDPINAHLDCHARHDG